MFLRGLPHICSKMRRPQKGFNISAKDVGQCPDFYKISKFAPLPDSEGVLSQTEDDNPISLPEGDNNNADCENSSSQGSTKDNNSEYRETRSIISAFPNCETPKRESALGLTNNSTPGPKNQLSPMISLNLRKEMMMRNKMTLSPIDLLGMHDLGDGMQSSGESVSSWIDQHDIWGTNMSASASISSEQDYSGLGQVTPPTKVRTSGTRFNMCNTGAMSESTNMVQYLPQHPSTIVQDQGVTGKRYDNSLTVADLCYLTQQNQILLGGTQKMYENQNSRDMHP